MPPNLYWTEERLHCAMEIFRGSFSIDEGLKSLSVELNRKVSYSSIAHALRTNGFPTVDSLIQQRFGTKLDTKSPRLEPKPAPEDWEDPLVRGEVKTLIMSDLHVPCEDLGYINQALEQDGDADQLVLAGDIFDMDQISHFGSERDGVLRREYNVVLGYLQDLSPEFERVYMIWGNHEFRMPKWIRKKAPAIQFLFGEMLANLAQGIVYSEASGRSKEQVDLPNVFYHGGEDGWWVKIGDAVVAHPRSFYKGEGRTAMHAFDYFRERMGHNVLQCVVCGHTHFLARLQNSERLAMECGCLCKPMTYAKEGVLGYKKPAEPGYAVIYQVDGVTDVDRSKFVDLRKGLKR